MKAKCFYCGKEVDAGMSMEKLLDAPLPVFCNIKCSILFPDNGTEEFDKKIEELKQQGRKK